jgi:hypothetical protein
MFRPRADGCKKGVDFCCSHLAGLAAYEWAVYVGAAGAPQLGMLPATFSKELWDKVGAG